MTDSLRMKKLEYESKAMVIQNAVDILDYKIKQLEKFYPPLQVSAWRKNRAKLKKEIKEIKIKIDLIGE